MDYDYRYKFTNGKGDRDAAQDLADQWIPRLKEMASRVRSGGLKCKRAIDDAVDMFSQVVDAPPISIDGLLQICEALEDETDAVIVADVLGGMAGLIRRYASGELQDDE